MKPGKARWILPWAVIASLAIIAVALYSQRAPVDEMDEAEALENLAETVPSTLPDSTLSMMSSKAMAAIKKKDFEHAVKIAMALSRVNGATPEQQVMVRNTIQNVKMNLAEAASDGDTNAFTAIERFKNSPVGR